MKSTPTNQTDCAIRDIKDFRDGIMTKSQLCKYLSKDLDVDCRTWGLSWILGIVGALNAIFIARIIGVLK